MPCEGKPKASSKKRLRADNIDFKTKTVRRDIEGHPIMIKESIPQKDTLIANVSNGRALNFIKQTQSKIQTPTQ